MADLSGAEFAGSGQSAARCLVCGNDIAAGAGLAVRWQERTLRFRCLGCLARFEADPERYLVEHATDFCRMEDADGTPMRVGDLRTVARSVGLSGSLDRDPKAPPRPSGRPRATSKGATD